MIRAYLIITGRVQGVFFRATAQKKARDLGITGWIGNCGDGSVEGVVEGSENGVNTFIDWCWSGPSTAEVKKVDIQQQTYSGEFEDFEIRY